MRASVEFPPPGAFPSPLAAVLARAEGPPSLTDYRGLLQACHAALRRLLGYLERDGYHPWLLLAEVGMTPERRAGFPTYSLFSPAAKLGLVALHQVEETFRQDGKVRTAGLYRVAWRQFVELSDMLTRNSWAMVVLSRRAELGTSAELSVNYRLAAEDADGAERRSLDRAAAAGSLAPLGDLVLPTDGWSDDKFRSLLLLYAFGTDAAALVSAFRTAHTSTAEG